MWSYQKISLTSWFGRRKISEKALIIVLVAGLFGGVVGYSQITHGSVDCSLYTSGTQVPAGYAVPYNIFSTTKELFLKATCDTTAVTITAGMASSGRYIYKYGYEWKNGGWQKYLFTGNSSNGDWFQDMATAQLIRTSEEMNETNYVVAYICDFADNSWKCGCRDTACTTPMWQMQGFKKPPQTFVSASANGIWGDYDELMVGYLSSQTAPSGSRITITGAGFSLKNDNTVILGSRSIKGVAATTIHSLTFTIPSDIPTGLVYVKVANDKGTSPGRGALLMVTKPGVKAPTILSVTPTSGPHGTKVTIRGTGFTPTNNNIVAGYGVIEHLPSPDGTTITTTLLPFPDNPEMQKGATSEAFGKSYTLHLYVLNENGISLSSAIFKANI